MNSTTYALKYPTVCKYCSNIRHLVIALSFLLLGHFNPLLGGFFILGLIFLLNNKVVITPMQLAYQLSIYIITILFFALGIYANEKVFIFILLTLFILLFINGIKKWAN